MNLLLGTTAHAAENVPDSTGIELQVRSGAGEWMASGRRHPGGSGDLVLWNSITADSVRLVFHGSYEVQSLSWIVPGSNAPVTAPVEPGAIHHSRLGDLEAASSAPAVLLQGDVLTLEYEGDGGDGELFFLHSAASASSQAARSEPIRRADLPARTWLWPSAPNPVTDHATIRFDLSIAAQVQLDLFDLQGRRVRTLAHGRMAAGSHAVRWDVRGARRIAPGVYGCRLQAGDHEPWQKVVVTP